MIIGFSGLARSGKNEAANALVAQGFESIAFADKLKDFFWQLNPIMENHSGTHSELQLVFKLYGGWEGMKLSPYRDYYRQLIQRLGTEAGRGVLGESTWIDALDSRLVLNKNYAITDIRFFNEQQYVKSLDGITIRVERPGLEKVNNHESEQLLFESDYVIINNGSIEDLHQKVLDIYENQ